MWQYVAVCGSVWQYFAVVALNVAVVCSRWQYVAVLWQYVAVVWQYVAVFCSMLQYLMWQ